MDEQEYEFEQGDGILIRFITYLVCGIIVVLFWVGVFTIACGLIKLIGG